MPSNHTTNYQLSQWERTDKVLMDDFNADNAKIDGALGSLERTVTAHAALLPKLGNCAVYVGTYAGTGDGNPTVATVPGRPMFVYVQDHDHALGLISLRGMQRAYSIPSASYTYSMVWGDQTVSWNYGSSNSYSLNAKDHSYIYMVLYSMDE